MVKAKGIAAAFLITSAFGAVNSSFASASTTWVVNGTELIGSQELANTAENQESAKLESGGLTVTCSGSNAKVVEGKIESPNKISAASLIFTSCSATGEHCTLVGTTFTTVPITTEITLEGTLAAGGAFIPKTKNTIATLLFSGESCPIAGEIQPVTGAVSMSLPTGQDPTKKQGWSWHNLVHFGLKAATFTGKVITVVKTGQDFWAAVKKL